jgi:flavin reductase (DIM6/NTAB) family NADH-FMN oxidoreductase RutF
MHGSNDGTEGWTRRRFIESGSGVGVLVSAVGCQPDARGLAATAGEGVAQSQSPQTPTSTNRVSLAEPGPMVPPVPAVLLTINGAEGDPDEISVLWTFVVEGNPPHVGVSAGSSHLARRLLETHNEFVLNVPSVDMVEAFDTVDMNSSRVGDKFALSGLTRGRATVVDAPTVEEAPVQCECRIIGTLEVPPERKLFIAEVVATTALEHAVDEDGRLIVPAARFFGMTAGSGEHYSMGEPVGHIGMTVGRTDIRY